MQGNSISVANSNTYEKYTFLKFQSMFKDQDLQNPRMTDIDQHFQNPT